MFINIHKCSNHKLLGPAGLQMVWENGTQDDLGQVPLAGSTVLLDTFQIDLKMSHRQGLHMGDGCGPSPCRG